LDKTESLLETADKSVERVVSFRYYSTGSVKLDSLLGGGFRAGTLTEVFGRSNSGKSQVAMQTALVAARDGAQTLYMDTEGSFRPERLQQISEARGWETRELMERIVYVRSDSAPEQTEAIRRMPNRVATVSSKLVVIDTLTRNFSVELPGSTNLSSRQAALDVHLSEMARDAYLNGRAYILTNRVTFGATRDVGIGGRTVGQMVGASIMLERDAARVKATKVGTGQSATVELTESGLA
jgi:RecA/RadA recombinase